MKEISDTESSEGGENIEENSESGEEIESGEESGENGEEIESGEEIDENGEESEESGEEIDENGEESEKSGEEIEGGKVEVDEVGSPGVHVRPDTINSAGLVGSDGSGPVGSGPAGPVGPVGPTGSAGPAESLVLMPVISILPPTPVKNKGKGKTPDDNQEVMLQDHLPDSNPDSLMVDNDESGSLKRGREHSGTGEVRGSKTHRRSASHSTAPTVPSTEDDDMEDLDKIDPQGSSRSTGGFSRGRAAGNNFNWGDAHDTMDPPDWNPSTYGKVLLYVNRDTGTSPLLSFSTEATSELPVVLKELSGRFSPIEKRNSRIYVFEDELWEVKGRFSQAMKDRTPLEWEMKDDGNLVLNLLAVGVVFYIVHIYNLNHFQDDLVDEFMNPKSASGSAAGSIYIKSSASGSAASSFVAQSDMAETGSNSAIQLGPMQKILIDTFTISAHLLQRKKATDLRLTYAKYLAIQTIIEDVGDMERAATWKHQKPTVEDIAMVFMSPSGYFHRPNKLFPRVVDGSDMQKWLEGGEDAPAQSDVWGDKKPSFKSLEEILDSKKKKVTSHKRKQKNDDVVVQVKGKEKAKAKKAGEGSKKKAGPKKSHQNDD